MTSDRLTIAVYAISKNEERHVARFLESVRSADVIVVADTGSTDGTFDTLVAAGVQARQISISPWRFDDARNAALSLVPANVDVCVSLDLDEVLKPGWRDAIEHEWTARTTRLRYRFVASWESDGTPGTVFWNDRIHARHGYRWQMPVHEVLMWCGDGVEEITLSNELEAHHHPDESKSRAQYLPMLQQLAREQPNDPRAAHYLAREYYFWQQYGNAIDEFKRELAMVKPGWPAQRSEACRLIAKSFAALGDLTEAIRWHWQAVHERPEQREGWVDLSLALYQSQDFAGGFYTAHKCLLIENQVDDYFNEPHAWGALPHDLLSICAWQIGLHQLAMQHAQVAARLSPDDERIRQNVRFFAEHVV